MNKTFLVFSIYILLISCNQSDNKVSTDIVNNPATASDPTAINTNLPEITFVENIFDFGKINEGESITHEYKFVNTGKVDLLISKASASCGCTVPVWPKEPIKPGAENKILVTFNSEGKAGIADKQITIVANTQPMETKLLIKGEVIAKQAAIHNEAH